MGFFKNLFKRKEGGTFVGNLLRGGASAMTGGILGSGAGLARWEAEQRQKEQEEALRQIRESQAYRLGNSTINDAVAPTMANGQNSNPNIGNNVVKETLKKYWYYVVGGLVAFGALIYFITKKTDGKKSFRK